MNHHLISILMLFFISTASLTSNATSLASDFANMPGRYMISGAAGTHDPRSFPCPSLLKVKNLGQGLVDVVGYYRSNIQTEIPITRIDTTKARYFNYKTGTYSAESGYAVDNSPVTFKFISYRQIKFLTIQLPEFSVATMPYPPRHLNCTYQNLTQ